MRSAEQVADREVTALASSVREAGCALAPQEATRRAAANLAELAAEHYRAGALYDSAAEVLRKRLPEGTPLGRRPVQDTLPVAM